MHFGLRRPQPVDNGPVTCRIPHEFSAVVINQDFRNSVLPGT